MNHNEYSLKFADKTDLGILVIYIMIPGVDSQKIMSIYTR